MIGHQPLELLARIPIQQIQAQSHREGDVAVTLTRGGPRFASEVLVEYVLGLYAAPSYLAGFPQIATQRDLLSHRVVGYAEDLLVSRELDYPGDVLPTLRARVQCSSLQAQVAATCSGAGICILPHFLAPQNPRPSAVLAGEVELRRTYWLNITLEMVRVPRVRAVAAFLGELAEQFDFS